MRNRFHYSAVFLCAALLASVTVAGPEEKITLEQLLERHRAGLGPAPQEGATATRTLRGITRVVAIVGPAMRLTGNVELASEGRKFNFLMRLDNSKYPGERFVFNGQESYVDYTDVGVRSKVGGFLHHQDQILKSGLFGGILTAGWPLAGPLPEGVKLEYEGLKKKDDRKLHHVRYRIAKGGGDTEIRLFFDPETLHHVLTEYRVTVGPSIGFTETDSAQQQNARTILEEEFSSFQTVQGLNLPARWRIRFTTEGAATLSTTATTITEWQVIFQSVDVNLPVDPALFTMK